MSFDYVQTQAEAKAILQDFGAIKCCIRFTSDNTTTPTSVIFDVAEQQNVDNRQHPTTLSGVPGQRAYIPGDVAYAPNLGDKLEWRVGTVTYSKRIAKVETIKPTTIPLLYILTIQ